MKQDLRYGCPVTILHGMNYFFMPVIHIAIDRKKGVYLPHFRVRMHLRNHTGLRIKML